MIAPKDRRTFGVRALLESTATPFAVAYYAQRDTIFVEGDPCDSVMHIEDGSVLLAVTAPGGKEGIVGLLAPGAFLGEEALSGRATRRHTATAMSATELLVVPKAQVIRLLRTHHAFADRFIAYELVRSTRLEVSLADQLLNSSERRLARMLLMLSGCGRRSPCRCALPSVSQEILAEMVGTTRSRVNVFIGKFKKLGFVEEHRGVLHVRPALLPAVYAHPGVLNGTSPPSLAR